MSRSVADSLRRKVVTIVQEPNVGFEVIQARLEALRNQRCVGCAVITMGM